ncbi:MAG: hypothetical protein HN817_01560 [Porticoccaceae bacterium]|nr:hypothetical protein [Porticoccaceae bacterium]MBT5578638.1 hypothetical protein [Porticoccaceae bacterium]MBT7374599.1 hypothetical protein [Porticoccaceae bacterium]
MKKGLITTAAVLAILFFPVQVIAEHKSNKGFDQSNQKWQHYRSHVRAYKEHSQDRKNLHRGSGQQGYQAHHRSLEKSQIRHRRAERRQHRRWHRQEAYGGLNDRLLLRYHHHSHWRHSTRDRDEIAWLTAMYLLNDIYSHDHR